MFTFYIKNHEPFASLTKNYLWLDKNKSIASTFSIFVVYKSAVNTIQNSNYVECFNFRQWRFVFARILPDISIKSKKLHFQRWRKSFSYDLALFPYNDCQDIKK